MGSDNSLSWRCREAELDKENVPAWREAWLRRQNVTQLFNEAFENELDYDAFSLLYSAELKKYSNIVDGRKNDRTSLQEEVAKLVPDFKTKLESLTSSLNADKLLKTENVKLSIEESKLLSKPGETELQKFGHCTVFAKKRELPENHPKSTNLSKTNLSATYGVNSKWNNHRPEVEEEEVGNFNSTSKKSNYKFRDRSKQNKRKFEKEDIDDTEMEVEIEKKNPFKSAREQLEIDQKKKKNPSPQGPGGHFNPVKKSLGARPRNGCFSKFVPPTVKDRHNEASHKNSQDMEVDANPRLKGIEPKIIELVTNEIMDHGPPIGWDDIAGLEFAKTTIKEIVIWPMLRPDIFTGLRGPPKGILLFGPPGTGKTLIGKCIASQSGATFFSISASSLTSKWVGEGEKMVRALFAVAACHQPAVIFIDEIDSLLAQRSDTEHESSRRIKTEFLVQLDGAATSSDERILVVGATNRPQEIDEAARRRLSKRLYIPLPEPGARKQIVESLLQKQGCNLPEQDITEIVSKTEGYSGADMANLCREAALGPIRSLQGVDISAISKDDVRPIILDDFRSALQRVRPSVSAKDLNLFLEWNKQFGCCSL